MVEITLSLRELVYSGLSKCTLSLNNEATPCLAGVKDLGCVNAAKLSLLLAQTLARCSDSRCGDESIVIDWTCLELNDFVVKLACSSASELNDVTPDKAGGKYNSFEQNDYDDDQPLDFKNDQVVENDVLLDFLSDFSVKHDECYDTNEIETHLRTNGENLNAGAEDSSLEKPDQSAYSYDEDKFDEINFASNTHWTLLGMEMRVRVHENHSTCAKSLVISQTMKLQGIGRMIYEIFMPRDNKLLPALPKHLLSLEESSIETKSNSESDLGQRSSKLMRCREKSLFSYLSEACPISVARLLSDMIDTSDFGMADAPFTTLEDVTEDLKQMSSQPWLYLYDPDDGFFSNLRFGSGCYGRTEQVTSFLSVASTLEGGNGRGSPQSSECVEGVLVSGIAGAGKTFLIHTIGDYFTSQGWIVLGAKFEMGLEHESRSTVSCVFDKLVNTLVSMGGCGIGKDVEYGRLALEAIFNALDGDSMSSLATFLPSIKQLVYNTDEDGSVEHEVADLDKGISHWRLVFLLSSLLGAVLSVGRRIIIYFDDIQWSDPTTASLIIEIVISMGRLPHARQRFLFVAMYRDNEVTSSHPSTSQLEGLQRNVHVNITSINLPSLSKNEIIDMMMTELRLPRRIVLDLSDIVHKKTSGHALFVIQLLNSLVRDAIVFYSPTKKRYQWDSERLNNLQTWDDVASLIVSNLSLLSPADLKVLELLSCFGTQTHRSIIQHIGSCSTIQVEARDIESSLPRLIDVGIIEENRNSMIKFSHDLIHSEVYLGIAVNQRRQVHLHIGEFLGSNTMLDNLRQHISIETGREHEHSEEKKQEDAIISSQPLFFVATDQINKACDLITDHLERVKFAGWNQRASMKSLENSNFQASLHYCKHGISFLAGKLWNEDTQRLCCSLYRGAAFASLAIGKHEMVPQYANAIIDNLSFERSLEAQYLLIRSLEGSGCKNEETVMKALAVLRRLGFVIPSAPKLKLNFLMGSVRGQVPSILLRSIKKTDKISSRYDLNNLIDGGGSATEIDEPKIDVLRICGSMILAGIRLQSPYLPLVICEAVNYSLEQGCVCGESALSFSYFGYLKIWLEEDYDEGYRWGTMALRILKKESQTRPFIRTRYVLYSAVLAVGRPFMETAQDLFETYELGLKFGDVSSAFAALGVYIRWSMFSGEKLSSLQAKFDLYLKQMVKYNIEEAKMTILSQILAHLLMGVSSDSFSILDGMICDENFLLLDALSKKNLALVMGIYWRRFFFDFWMGNYSEARGWAVKALSYSKCSGPSVTNIKCTVARGLIAFRLYREGKGTEFFNEGKEMLDELEKLLKFSELFFKNKVLLLQAELYASNCEVRKAKETYEASIRSATNYGGINDQAHAYEMMGDYLTSILEIPEATDCYRMAHKCYLQWGAAAKAKKIQEDHHIDLAGETLKNSNVKHGRDW